MKMFYSRISYHIKRLLIDIVCKLGFRKELLRNRKGQRILLYHGIDDEGRTDLNGRYLSVDRFEAQIRYLKERFNIVTLTDLFEGRVDPNRFNVAITFDDGYRNNLTLALPILERYEVPATFFLTAITATEYSMLWADYLDLATFVSSKPISIDGEEYLKKKGQYFNHQGESLKSICKQNDWDFKKKLYTSFPDAKELEDKEELKIYWQQLNPDEIKQLDASPWASIGVHAFIHDNLGRLPAIEAISNLQEAKAYLEKIVQHPIYSVAYADGSYSQLLLDLSEELGFSEQYAVDYLFPENKDDRRILNRLTINPYTSLDHQVYAILNGGY